MIYKINGKEIKFDVFDLDLITKLDDGLDKLEKDEKKAAATLTAGKLKEGVQALYATYQDFFITVAGFDVVDGCNNALKAQKMAVDFITQVKNNILKKNFDN